ncbi:MAG: hypothetical protein ACRDRK_24200 [Pseudonocardia sp.]
MGELPERVRRRLDEVFGDVAPSTTGDESGRDEPGGLVAEGASADEELVVNRPPHHDRD